MALSISFPLSGSAAIETLDGSNWSTWSLCIIALLHMNGLKNHTTEASAADSNDKEWGMKQEMVLGVLEMYCQKDVWTAVSNDSKFKMCKDK